MLKKSKSFAVLAIIVLAVIAIVIGSCSRDKEITAPEQPKDEFASFKAKAQMYQDWIERMEPYVTKNTDGTFSLEWDKFIVSIQGTYPEVAKYFQDNGQPSDQTKIIEELKNGIPLANEELLKSGAFGKRCAEQSSACWYFWWGVKCCYWGTEGLVVTYAITAGQCAPWPVNLIFWGLGGYAQYIWYTYHHICLNRTWVGGYWITS